MSSTICPTTTFQVPVAQMVPQSSDTSITTTLPRRDADTATAPQFNLPEESHNTDGELGSNIPAGSNRTIRRRDVSCPQTARKALPKRTKSPSNQEARKTKVPRTIATQGPREEISCDNLFTRLSYPSPQESSQTETAPRNFPTIPARHEADGGRQQNPIPDHLLLSLEDFSGSGLEQMTVLNSHNGDDNINSLQNPSARTPTPSRAISPGKGHSLVVVLKLSYQGGIDPGSQAPLPAATPTQHSQYNCSHLTSNLLDLLETSEPEQKDITAFEETVKYIHIIKSDGMFQLEQTFGDEYEKYQTVLDRWLGCAKAFIIFRKTTQFSGDRSKWPEFFKGLDPEKRKTARTAFMQTRSVIHKWCQEPDFSIPKVSKDLAHVFFNMAAWEGTMELEELQELCIEFNGGLLAWFG